MRVAVYGAGGVGAYFGGRLAQAGDPVTFIARGAHLDALRTGGLRVDSIKGDFVVQPARATDDPGTVGPVDLVLVGVKAWQVPEAGAAMRPLVGPDTLVLPLQNGVEAPAQLAAALGSGPVVGGLCGISSFVVAPGHVRHVAIDPFIRLGELDKRPSARTETVRQAFLRAGVTAEIPPDIHAALWLKLLFIAPSAGVGAVSRTPVGIWRHVPEAREVAERGMEEIVAVARARKIPLPGDAVPSVMAMVDGLPPATTMSLQRDLAEGRPSELDAQIGAVGRLGREVGVVTPVHDFLYASLRPGELRARGQIDLPA